MTYAEIADILELVTMAAGSCGVISGFVYYVWRWQQINNKRRAIIEEIRRETRLKDAAAKRLARMTISAKLLGAGNLENKDLDSVSGQIKAAESERRKTEAIKPIEEIGIIDYINQ